MAAKGTVATMECAEAAPTSRFHVQLHKIPSGLVKLLQLGVGAACIALVIKYSTQEEIPFVSKHPDLGFVFRLSLFVCMMTTFLLLISYLTSHSAATVLHKSVFELLYHSSSFILYTIGSIYILYLYSLSSKANDDPELVARAEALLALGLLAMVNASLYVVGAYCNYHAFKAS